MLKYNITKDGKVQHLTITDLNDCRVQFIALMDKYISSTQAKKLLNFWLVNLLQYMDTEYLVVVKTQVSNK